MRKLKQVHVKLVFDIENSNVQLSLLNQAQDVSIKMICRTRLTLDLPDAKEDDLHFTNFYLQLDQNSETPHVVKLLNLEENVVDDNISNASGSDNGKDNLGSPSDPSGFAMTSFMNEKAPTHQNAAGTNALSFNSFDQVMLALRRVEEGLVCMYRTFHRRWLNAQRQAVRRRSAQLNAQEFTAVFRLCSTKNVQEEKVRAAIRSIHEFVDAR